MSGQTLRSAPRSFVSVSVMPTSGAKTVPGVIDEQEGGGPVRVSESRQVVKSSVRMAVSYPA